MKPFYLVFLVSVLTFSCKPLSEEIKDDIAIKSFINQATDSHGILETVNLEIVS